MTYNLLFWEHEKKGCNGMRNILLAYYNVTQRNQFTTEEFAHVKSSITMMQIEKDRLEKKIKKKLEKKAQMRRGKVAEG
jgi:F0F1-type ATP synthase delta subunit